MGRKIYFTRHGETEDNVIARLSTNPPGPNLTALGRKQAEELRDNMKNIKISKIYVSPLKRAVETATILNKNYNVEIIKDERIAELLVGDKEGRNDSGVFEELEDVWKAWSLENKLDMLAGKGGDSANTVIDRCNSFLKDLFNSDEDEPILVVAHSGVLQLFIGHLCANMEPIFCYENYLRNCQLVETEIHNGKLLCLKWGDVSFDVND